MLFRTLVATALLLAFPGLALAGLPQGTFTVDAVINESADPWVAQIQFVVSERGDIIGGKILYPNDPCRVEIAKIEQSGNTVIFYERVVKGNEICSPGRYTFVFDPSNRWKKEPWKSISCEMDGKTYAGRFRKQIFAASGASQFYKNNGVAAWDDVAAKEDWETLIQFYNKVSRSEHRPDALTMLKGMAANDVSGRKAFELTERCQFEGEWEYLQATLTPDADFDLLLMAMENRPYSEKMQRMALDCALKKGGDGYNRFLTAKSEKLHHRAEMVINDALRKNDFEGLEKLSKNENISKLEKYRIVDILFGVYAKRGDDGYRKFIQAFPESSNVATARNALRESRAQSILASNDIREVRSLLYADTKVLSEFGVSAHVFDLFEAERDSDQIRKCIRRIDDRSLKRDFEGLLKQIAFEKRREEIKLAIDQKNVKAVRGFIPECAGQNLFYSAEKVLYDHVEEENSLKLYEDFLTYSKTPDLRNSVIESIYELIPQSSEAELIAFANKYPDHAKAAEVWDSMYQKAVDTSFLSSSIDQSKLQAFFKLKPPSEFVNKAIDALGESMLSASRDEQLAFMESYPHSEYCQTLRERIAEECLSEKEISELAWFVARFRGTEEADRVSATLAQEVYDEIISDKDTIDAYNYFCVFFYGVAPKPLLEQAYERAMKLHRKKLQKQLDDAGGLFTSDVAENENYEKIVRRLFHEADQLQSGGDSLRARQLVELISTTDELVTTQTFRDSERDKKMRDFLERKFNTLIRTQKDMSRVLADRLEAVASNVSKNRLTREDFRQFNQDKMWDGRTFRQVVGEY